MKERVTLAKKNRIEDLRDHLFATLEALQDDEKPMDLARASAVADVARAVIESAKVEVEFLKATNQIEGTGFIPVDETERRLRLAGGTGRR